MVIMPSPRKHRRAFTLIELLVVMAIIATLLTLVVPRYFKTVDRSQEKVLQTNLATVRDAIDKYYGDHGTYPATLETLVTDQYIREIPQDPVAGGAEAWIITPPPGVADMPGVYDIHSGAAGVGKNGKPYREW